MPSNVISWVGCVPGWAALAGTSRGLRWELSGRWCPVGICWLCSRAKSATPPCPVHLGSPVSSPPAPGTEAKMQLSAPGVGRAGQAPTFWSPGLGSVRRPPCVRLREGEKHPEDEGKAGRWEGVAGNRGGRGPGSGTVDALSCSCKVLCHMKKHAPGGRKISDF